MGIEARFDLSSVFELASGSNGASLEAVLAQGLCVDDELLTNTVDAWNADHESDGLSISASLEWVKVAEDGSRSDASAADENALQLLKLAIASKGGSTNDGTFKLNIGLKKDAESYVRSRADVPTAQQPVFYDACTAVIKDDGTVGIESTPGVSVSVGDQRVEVESPVLLCCDASHAARAKRGVASASAEQADGAQDSSWYIDGFTLDRVFSGTAKWDKDNAEGHDSASDNDVIRSYDSVIYSTSYALAVENGVGTAKTGKLHVEATLPLSVDLMTWDLDSMVWLKNAKVTTTGSRQKLEGDVVFGGDSSVPVAPSVGMLNFVAKVRDVSQGESIKAPKFTLQRYANDSVSMEGDVFTCGTVNGSLQNTPAKNANLKGSAKGQYNAQLKAEGGNRYTITLQMRSDSGGLKGMALPKDQQLISVSLESNWYQNLRAVKVNRLGVAQSAASPTYNVFTKDDYGKTAPYAGQSDGSSNTTFNTIYNSGAIGVKSNNPDSGSGVPARYEFEVGDFKIDRANIDKIAPTHNSARVSESEQADYDRDVVYNFGSYLFEVDGPKNQGTDTTYVKITDLKVEDSAGVTSGDCYAEDNECTQVHKPAGPIDGDTGFYINYNTEFKYGISTERVASNGALSPMPDINGGSYSSVYEVAPGETFVTASTDQFFFIDDDSQCYFSRKDAPRYVTKFLKFDDEVFEVDPDLLDDVPARVHVFSQDSGWRSHGYANVVTKYVTKPGGWNSDEEILTTHLINSHATHYDDMPSGDLTVHDSFDAAKSCGDPIIGVVFDILVDEQLTNSHLDFQDQVKRIGTSLYVQIRSLPLRIKTDATVRDGQSITDKSDPRLVGILTWDSTASCVDMYRTEVNEQTGKTENVNTHAYRRRSGIYTTIDKWQWINRGRVDIVDSRFSADIFTGYKKAKFDANGNISKAAESAARLNGAGDYDFCPASGGASFYVRLNGIDVSKEVAQQSNGTPKVNFDLDQGQRRVDFSLDSLHTGSELSKLTDTVTLTDTIPAGLNPVNPAAETPAERWNIAYGGVYKQDKTTNGGAGGEWVSSGGDTTSHDPSNTAAWKKMQAAMSTWSGSPELSYKVTEQANSDGSTTLTWTFENVPVSYRLPKIHYSARLGSADDPFHDLVNGDSVVNTVSAKLTRSGATDSDSSTVAVVRAQNAAIIKTPKVEKRSPKGTDPMGFDITFVNNANDENASLQLLSVVDILPGADDKSWSTTSQGVSELKGYKLANVTFDAVGFSQGESQDPPLYMAYMTNASSSLTREKMRLMQKQGTLYGSMTNIEYQTHGWSYLRISFDESGNLTASSKKEVQDTLNGTEVTAIGFFTLGGTKVPPGAMFKLGYEYSWADSSQQLAHNVNDTFTNTVTLSAMSLKKSVESKATTVPTPSEMDLEFTKVDGKSGSALEGAEFKLFRWKGTGNAPTTGLIDPNNYDDRNWELADTVTSGADGKVKFAGLGSLDGSPDYRLIETKAPAGYVLPGGQWNVRVDVLNEEISFTAINGDGGVQPPAFDNSGGSLKLPNYLPMGIPSSGGRGTALFALAGGAISLAGLWMCILHRRTDTRTRV